MVEREGGLLEANALGTTCVETCILTLDLAHVIV